MSYYTDKERLDFLSRGRFTRWVGYNIEGGHCTWPVFDGEDLRQAIDSAMDSAARALLRKAAVLA